jgi:hypothetical protein
MSQSSSSTAPDEHRLGSNLRSAINEATAIVSDLSTFPVDVSFSAFVVIDGRGKQVKTKSATLYRPNPGLMEQFHENLWIKFNDSVPEEERTVNIEVKDIRMSIKKKNKVVQICPCCHVEVKIRMLRHLKERCPVSQGKYCMNCASMVEGDMEQHIIDCRSRKYHCASCGEEFLHSSTLRAHQSHCRQIKRAEEEVSRRSRCMLSLQFAFAFQRLIFKVTCSTALNDSF